MLQRDAAGELNEHQRKMIDEAEKSCARLVSLITEMSDVAKLDSGAIALARQPLDVFALVSEVAEHVQEAKDREVRLEVRGAYQWRRDTPSDRVRRGFPGCSA